MGMAMGGGGSDSGAGGANKQIGDSSKQALFGNEQYTLEEAWIHRDKALREFAMAYCFLLLLVSRNTQEPAKERMYFEYIYALSRELIIIVVSLPAFSTLLDTELNRLFRSDLFCGSDVDESSHAPEPVQQRSAAPLIDLSRLSTTLSYSTHKDDKAAGYGLDQGTPPSRLSHRRSVRPDSGGSSSRMMSRYGTVTTLKDIAPSLRPESGRSKIGGVGRPESGRSIAPMARPDSARFMDTDTRPGSGRSVIGGAPPIGMMGRRGGRVMAWGGGKGPSASGKRGSLDANPLLGDGIDEGVESQEEAAAEGVSGGIIPLPAQQQEDVKPMKIALSRRKKISINVVRMARSPLADAVLPPPQRFLFVQTRPDLIGNLVGV
ncbi:hypothetical protein HDV00_008818 [Rhizophlyctis rosea]|nr:hypothetical protein HDV00_008818 [Rhizophlyctis rosea]